LNEKTLRKLLILKLRKNQKN